MPLQPAPPAKVHLPSEVIVAKSYLTSYRNLYPVDLSDAGLIYLLIGYQNYLNAYPSGAGALNTLKASGYI